MLGKTRIVLAGLGIAVLLTPGAVAHPLDVYLFAAGPTGVFDCVPGGIETTPPCYFTWPFTVAGVGTTVVGGAFGVVTGSGTCNTLNEACFAWPTYNPFTGLPPAFWTCEITSVAGPWAFDPTVYLVQDTNNNDFLGDGADVVYVIGIAAGNPVAGPPGGIPFTPGPVPGVGAFGSAPFGPLLFPPAVGVFTPGYPVHAVSAHIDPGTGLGLPNPSLDLTLTCWVWS